MGFDSLWHCIVLLAIVLLVFGSKKIRNLGPDLGAAIRDFKRSLGGDDETKKKENGSSREQVKHLHAAPSPADSVGAQSQHDFSETK
jgi:sec-independent protein translocase protein TatA